MNKVAFHTFGCKLNFSETSMIAQEFYNKGYAKVGKHDIADIYYYFELIDLEVWTENEILLGNIVEILKSS